ncbi:branched-chain amino acid ABC transporter permease [Limnochorda pilosa]|uniref:Amino acid ABC transporter permease n=1 Tax=Limnochorda pilosa TaxID=1555112 RepID=A0A0K2SG33_LIMPI|nr:branched-chain amino acid ABC transporter permease [Limnochorda pilosa]BAS26061.1 amino acid ABC transporter permease [Limnochorda pilosa]
MVQLVVYGLVSGAIIALGAIGLTLIFRILNFAHFAHGDMMTLGAYLAFLFHVGLGWPLAVAAPAAVAGTVLAALVLDRLLYLPFRRSNPVVLLIASVGAALILRNGIQAVFGPDNLFLQQGVQFPLVLPGGVRVKPIHLLILGLAVVLVVLLHLFLTRTRLGKAMRAVADNPDLAGISGIKTEQVVRWTWGLGAVLAGTGGILLALDTHLQPVMGWTLLLPIFAAVVLGGVGNLYGAILGALAIGIVQELATAFLNPGYKPAVAFVLLVLVLVWRPTGLLGTGRAA